MRIDTNGMDEWMGGWLVGWNWRVDFDMDVQMHVLFISFRKTFNISCFFFLFLWFTYHTYFLW